MCLPFQVPAKPNYCLVMYYAADRPVSESSSLGKFVNGSDSYRDARFKLIPSIVQVKQTLLFSSSLEYNTFLLHFNSHG